MISQKTDSDRFSILHLVKTVYLGTSDSFCEKCDKCEVSHSQPEGTPQQEHFTANCVRGNTGIRSVTPQLYQRRGVYFHALVTSSIELMPLSTKSFCLCRVSAEAHRSAQRQTNSGFATQLQKRF